MSKYELLDYDRLQERIGITPGETWYCGGNPAADATFDEVEGLYDDSMSYTGPNPKMAGGFCLTEDINVNGLLLNHRDANNTIWICTGIDGWWTTPPAEIPDVPKPFWDGSLLTTGRYLSRTITISGIFPPDPSLVWYNRDALVRVSSIVRGIGLLAMCGNETPDRNPVTSPDDPFFDPPKMAIIQSGDVPLFDTTRANGFTQFSLSFRCVNSTKLSLYEKMETLPMEDTTGALQVTRKRYYKAFSMSSAEGDPHTTEYGEVENTTIPLGKRPYAEVENVNLDTLIRDEQRDDDDVWPTLTPEEQAQYYQVTGSEEETTLYNAGNYFAFPIFVFDQISGATPEKPIIVRNTTTNEQMRIQKLVPPGFQLVIDTGMRKVGVINPGDLAPTWKWDDRNYLTLTSAWITLAPGANTIVVSKPGDVVVGEITLPSLPRVYWRDTWIG